MEHQRTTGQAEQVGQVEDSGYRNALADGSFTAEFPPFDRLRRAIADGETAVVMPSERYSRLISGLSSAGIVASQVSNGSVSATVLKGQ